MFERKKFAHHYEGQIEPFRIISNLYFVGTYKASSHLIDTGDGTYSIYTVDAHRAYGKPKPLNRWEIRKDGFACYTAGADEKVLVTKPLVFEGSKLHLNFSGSAFGYIYVDLLDEDGNPISGESFEVFGDTIDREVFFADGSDFSAFAGKPVRIRFRRSDVKLYSMKFE